MIYELDTFFYTHACMHCLEATNYGEMKYNRHIRHYGMICKGFEPNPATAPQMVQQSSALSITPWRGVDSTMVRAADLWSCGYRVARSNPSVFICVQKDWQHFSICVQKDGQHFSLRNASGHPVVMGTYLVRKVNWRGNVTALER